MRSKIAIIGGGPSALFMYKRIVDTGRRDLEVHIYESKADLGVGMPYGKYGANKEHITNVSGNEIPELVTSLEDWIKALPAEHLAEYKIDPSSFSPYHTLPRLLFGEYLHAQFELLIDKGRTQGLETLVHCGVTVEDVRDDAETKCVGVWVLGENRFYDKVIICTGHNWLLKHEGKIEGYFDSPYPPAKLERKTNHAVAIRGSSLTAIDAVRTLARNNGKFIKDESGKLGYKLDISSPNFKMTMYSIHGILPGIRFHLEDSHLSKKSLLSREEMQVHRRENNGFISLDYVFEKDFKKSLSESDPVLYERIASMQLEEFVDMMMGFREAMEAFELFKLEYVEADLSIKAESSVHWKENLAILSFAMNYPAKYFSAEDTLRLKRSLMPLISMIIAFVPQSSCDELICLYDEGLLELISVNHNSKVVIGDNDEIIYDLVDKRIVYKTFVDSIGQPRLNIDDFPFKGLVEGKSISKAYIRFASAEAGAKYAIEHPDDVKQSSIGEYYMAVSGIGINDTFSIVNEDGIPNPRIAMMSVPYIGGFNPDYSGLDFCEEASGQIARAFFALELSAEEE